MVPTLSLMIVIGERASEHGKKRGSYCSCDQVRCLSTLQVLKKHTYQNR